MKKEKLKLGALLVSKGLINETQLDEALKNQVIFGGRLGTNLVELGYLDEEALAYFLSENLGVPYAHPKILLDIKPEVLSLISKEVAEKYKVLPLEVKKKRLKLVMADPQDYEAINEISFITGYVIEPMVTPEMRLMQALEKHYGLERSLKYLPFKDKIKEESELQDVGESYAKGISPSSHAPSLSVSKEEKTVEEKGAGEISEEVIREKVMKLKEKRREMLASLKNQSTSRKAVSGDSAKEKTVFAKLREAQTRNEVGEALLEYMALRYPVGAVLAVRGDFAYGWCGRGGEACDELVHKLRVPLSVPSIFKRAGEKGFAMQDGPDADPMDRMIRKLIRVEESLRMAAVSVYYNEVIVCFLLAVGPREIFTEQVIGELKTVAHDAGRVFANLIRPLKRQAT